MNVLGTGLSGLVGSRVVELLSPKFSFENLSLETGVDITKPGVVSERIGASNAPWVFHFAAKTDVDGAEGERQQAQKSSSWIVNVEATRNIVESVRSTGKKMLYISTDYVFDGTKEFYTEEDTPNPLGWYAQTKYEGERLVSSLGARGLIVRIANPYRAQVGIGKPDFVHKILDMLRSRHPVIAPSDQLFVPTFIDDIAEAIQTLIENNASGVFHVVGSQAISSFDACLAIARVFEINDPLITATSFDSYFKNRAPRPFRAVLKNDRIQKFGIHMSSFDEGLQKMKLQQAGKEAA